MQEEGERMLLFASTEIIITDLKRIGSQLNSLNFRKMEHIINRILISRIRFKYQEGPFGGGSCAQFTAIKDGKSRITIITFRVSQFTENNIVNEEQRRLHIDSFYSRSPRKATNHC